MADSYAWIFIVGIVVFFLIIVILLCFTRASGSQLFSSISANDPELGTEFVETPAMLETLSEDARLSYERAKGKYIFNILELAVQLGTAGFLGKFHRSSNTFRISIASLSQPVNGHLRMY
jgi:hypothetical protein